MSIRDLIHKHTPNRDALSAGLAAYQKGLVRNLTLNWETMPQFGRTAHTAQAEVDGYKAEIQLFGEELVSSFCNCYEEADAANLCRHRVALLRALSDRITPERQEDESKRRQNVTNLLHAYERQKHIRAHSDAQVSLFPTLDFDPYSQGFALSFHIKAATRSYVLKNLSDFYARLENETHHSYGKWLTLMHRREHFDENSQFYIDLIGSSIAIMRRGTSPLRQNNHTGVGRYLYLSDVQFDSLFQHVCEQGGHITCQKGHEPPFELEMKRLDPPVTLDIHSRPDQCYQLKLHMDDYTLHPTSRHTYLSRHQEMLLPGPAFQHDVMPLIRHLNPAPEQTLILTKDELFAFMGTAEPLLRDHINLHMDPELYVRMTPPELEIHLQLDYPWPNTIRGLLTFTYGNKRFNPLDEDGDVPSPCRNHAEEEKCLAILKKYRFSPNEDEWLLVGENALYTFLTEGLAELLPFATIDLEDRLAAIRPKAAHAPRMSAAMTKGVIELSFDESLYSTEELVQILDAYRAGQKFIRLDGEHFLDIMTKNIAQIDALLEDVGLRPDALFRDHIELPVYRADRLAEFKRRCDLDFDSDVDLQNLSERLAHPERCSPAIPAELKATLRPYQLSGFQWMVNLSELGMGGILADDMGLGKTVQTIAFLLHRKAHMETPVHSLIVVPTSLIYNWQEELDRFAPTLPYCLITGTAEERHTAIAAAPPGTLLITSYATLRRDATHYEHLDFDALIADEAQYIKNSYTQNAKALKSLRARHRFALTGTPMENALADLWSIMDFCMPGYLHSWSTFRHVYEIPITRYEDSTRMARLRRQMTPFLLRRVKKDVLRDLPDKIETTLYATLSDEETRIYQSQLALSQKAFIETLTAEGRNQRTIQILALLMRLRQVCCSPALFLKDYRHLSSKLRLALELIEDRRQNGRRMVLFSQFTSMLDLISEALEGQNIPHLVLTGQTPARERIELVNRFQTGEVPIFLISLKAGGVGLNLTAADTVIHYDPWWNQSVENQATDRTHRIGQDDTVHVIRLICKNTIEEKIMTLKEKKQTLAEDVVGSGSFFTQLSGDELRELFQL